MPDLNDISDKANSIYNGMEQSIKTALDQRINQASTKDRNKMKDVLHFSLLGKSGWTEGQRTETRRAVAGYLAMGGSIEGAKQFRKLLKSLPENEIKGIADKLTKEPADREYPMMRPFLSGGNPNANNNAQGMAVVLGGLPLKPNEAGNIPYAHNASNFAVMRDVNGKLVVSSKQDMILQIKQSCLSAGVSANTVNGMDAVLNRLDSSQAARVLSQMQGPNGDVIKGLSSAMDRKSNTAQQDYQAFKNVLAELPVDLQKAGQNISADENFTIKRNDQGVIEVLNADAKFTGIHVPNENKLMSGNKVQSAKDIFNNIAQTSYGRAGVPLDFMRHAREEALKDDKTTMQQALQSYRPNGSSISEKNQNADCLCLTEQLITELEKQGIKGYAAGVNNQGLTGQSVQGSNVKVNPEGAMLKSGGITHLDVIVPYTNENGDERALVFTPGMGTDPKWSKDIPLSEVNGLNYVEQQRIRLNGEGKGVDPEITQKSAMGYRSNIQITNGAPETAGNKQIAGIDLVNGKLYLNTAATNAYQGPKIEGQGALSFNYRDAIKNPNDKVIMKTSEGDVEVTKLEALAVFAEGVKNHFGLPDDFVDNVMHLAANEQQYQQAVLWDTVQTMHKLNEGQQVKQQQNIIPKLHVGDVLNKKVEKKLEVEDSKLEIEPEPSQKSLKVGEKTKMKKKEEVTPSVHSNNEGVSTNKIKDKITFYENLNKGQSTGGPGVGF